MSLVHELTIVMLLVPGALGSVISLEGFGMHRIAQLCVGCTSWIAFGAGTVMAIMARM